MTTTTTTTTMTMTMTTTTTTTTTTTMTTHLQKEDYGLLQRMSTHLYVPLSMLPLQHMLIETYSMEGLPIDGIHLLLEKHLLEV